MRFDEGPEWLHRRFPGATLRESSDSGADALAVLRGASESSGPLALHVRGTPFQVQVWQALLSLQPGERTTYGALAEFIGHPSSARAVGNAVGANPIAVLIPCHRVLRKEGALGGYRWGLPRKRALLAMELS